MFYFKVIFGLDYAIGGQVSQNLSLEEAMSADF